MKDDKYVFYIVSEMNTVGNSSGEKCHLVKKNIAENHLLQEVLVD